MKFTKPDIKSSFLKDSEDDINNERSVVQKPTGSSAKTLPLTAADFVKAVYSGNSESSAWNILQQIQHLSRCVKSAWKQYLWLVGIAQKKVFSGLYSRYLVEQRKGIERFFIKSILIKPTMETAIEWASRDVKGMHKKIVDRLRPNIELETFNEVTVI